MKRIPSVICMILFLLFAMVQWNDPDPVLWVGFYLFVSIVCGLFVFGKPIKGPVLIGLIVSLLWMGNTLSGFLDWVRSGQHSIIEQMKADSPEIEVAREFFGLCLAFLCLLYHYFIIHRKGKEKELILDNRNK
ncbi:MAG: hypothetical protein GYB31_02355 [Bacteroidetes bacterium]|nr:hypothetical protein [Bacteroidota bacterium]